jgi:hypothetical protein
MSFAQTGSSKTVMDGLAQLQSAICEAKWFQPQREVGKVGEDWMSGFGNSLESPVGHHPPLSQSVFAGDRVAIVLQSDLPQARLVVECLLKRLMDTSIEPTDITVVISPLMARQFGLADSPVEPKSNEMELQHPLDDEFRPVSFLVHDAQDEFGVAYIAANEEGLPVKVNRAIVDADVILPIGCPRSEDGDSLVDCIYPEYCHDETKRRYREQINSVKERRAEIELANDHLGAFYSIQIVAGAGGQILETISGERHAAIQKAESESRRAWAIVPVGSADAVVATIETDASQQTWKDFAKAVVAANSVANSRGPIVVWSEIGEQPKSEIRKALNDSFESVSRARLSGLMQSIADIAAERQIFLKSRLAQSVVEELGLGFVASVSDVVRLVQSQNSGVMLRDAHLCQVQRQLENVDVDK